MRKRRADTIDPILERTFGWLRPLGFTATTDPDMSVGATFASDAVVVRPTYHWHDEYADITIARRWTPEPAPYWAQVHLSELLERAAGMERSYNGVVRDPRALEEVLARGAALLQDVAPEQLIGRNLELLDEIIANRPHRGVPGLDFPVTEPWASSQEGLWYTTDFSGSPSGSRKRWRRRHQRTRPSGRPLPSDFTRVSRRAVASPRRPPSDASSISSRTPISTSAVLPRHRSASGAKSPCWTRSWICWTTRPATPHPRSPPQRLSSR
jgi:hypothetical protein